MSLASRQIKKELNRIVEEKMKSGFIASINLVRSELLKYYKKVKVGNPSFQMRHQAYRKIWDIDAYNDNLSELYDDLNNLYEEMVAQFTTVLINFDYNDTERRRLMHEMNTTNSDLNDLLLLADDIEGYLYSVHDTFIDRSKINLQYSTCEVNTDAGAVMLRESRNGIKKIDMSHYYDIEQYLILAERSFADKIVSNNLFAGSKFGYAFSDINTAWNQKVVTNEGGELQLYFVVEINPDIDDEVPMSRIEIIGHFSRPVKLEPLWSVDNINFKSLPMDTTAREKYVIDNRVQIWNFPEIRIQYLKFKVTMEEEDEAIGGSELPRYLYNFGFKNIAMFQTAYTSDSELYSKEFTLTDPTGESLTIDKVALVTDQDIPTSTDIEHYVSLGTAGETDPSAYNWVAISPLNDPNPSEPQLVDFRHIALLNNLPSLQWDSTTYDTPIASKNGIDFYQIYEFPYEPIRDSVELYRGVNNWQVEAKYDVSRRAIYDEAHTFTTGNTGAEYVTLINPSGFTPVKGDGLIRGSVKVKNSPGEVPDIMFTTPNDYTVDHENRTITRPKDSTMRSDGVTVYVDYQYDLEEADPTVFRAYIYILNSDGIDINISPFSSLQIEAGQFLRITTNGELTNLSSETSYHIPPGWHKIETTAEPWILSSDRFYSVNGNQSLYQLVYKLYAYGEKIQEVSFFELKNNIKKLDHAKYSIVDCDGDGNKELVVNYKPQTAKWTSVSATPNYDMLNPNSDAETYEFSYKYIATANDTIYYRAKLTRGDDTGADVTPTLREYTIRIGY